MVCAHAVSLVMAHFGGIVSSECLTLVLISAFGTPALVPELSNHPASLWQLPSLWPLGPGSAGIGGIGGLRGGEGRGEGCPWGFGM